jgi:hypothetical protein
VFTSQPSIAIALQFAKPVVHAPSAHAPAAQLAAAFAKLHALPQRPQCAALLVVSVSQPSAAIALQSPKPALHIPTPHAPLTHPGVPLATARHDVPQAPQCITLTRRSTSQPFVAIMSQLPKPIVQAPTPQTPAAQVGVAFGALHTVAQPPQRIGFVRVSTSHPVVGFESQSTKPASHASPHAPIVQVAVA